MDRTVDLVIWKNNEEFYLPLKERASPPSRRRPWQIPPRNRIDVRRKLSRLPRNNAMSENTPPPGAPGATPEPPKPADAAQKKQTVRISLPPKPAGGPSIRMPSTVPAPVPAAATPAASAAPMAPSSAAPSAPRPLTPGAAAPMGMSSAAHKPAMPAAAHAAPVGKAAPPAPRPAARANAGVSGLDVGLAFATVLCSLATVAALFLYQPIQ